MLAVTDKNGNATTCAATVSVQDTVRPIAICQNITTYLNNARVLNDRSEPDQQRLE